MRNAFVCCTPYHLIISIHMAQTEYKDYINDIYISDHFKDAYEIYKKIDELGLFNQSFFIRDKKVSYDKSKLKHKKIIKLLKLDLEDIVKESIPLDYDRISVFCFSYFSTVLVNKVKEKNKNIKIAMLEDGLGSYLINVKNRKEKMRGLLSSFFGLFNKNFFSFNQVSELYLFRPEYFVGDINISIRNIPNFTENVNLSRVLNNVFNYKEQSVVRDYQMLYFDQTFSADNIGDVKEEELLLEVLNIVEKSKMLIKLHPRDKMDKYEMLGVGEGNIYQSTYPWELIYLNESPSKSILISINSTAVLTPHLIFNKKHSMVLLYKIVGVQNEEMEKFVDVLRENNGDLSIFIPKNFEDMREILNKIT
ncbi:polysialyltransferase family glycosyltransferase [Bacillus albus]|uniref:polysialyltransferase family glycosyltransferase n=1 Tax=Bacillus albus TaxID=2026189 RepID=UPI003D231536